MCARLYMLGFVGFGVVSVNVVIDGVFTFRGVSFVGVVRVLLVCVVLI